MFSLVLQLILLANTSDFSFFSFNHLFNHELSTSLLFSFFFSFTHTCLCLFIAAPSSLPGWNPNFNCNDTSPGSYSQGSPNLSYSSPGLGHYLQDPIPGPVPVSIPPPDPGPHQRVSVITEQYKPATVVNSSDSSDRYSAVFGKDESLVLQAPPRSGGVQGDLANSTQEPSSIPRTNAMHNAGMVALISLIRNNLFIFYFKSSIKCVYFQALPQLKQALHQ